jgi:hypothetical protein
MSQDRAGDRQRPIPSFEEGRLRPKENVTLPLWAQPGGQIMPARQGLTSPAAPIS